MSVKAIAVNPKDPSHFIAVELPQTVAKEFDLLVNVKAVSINPLDTKVPKCVQKSGLDKPKVLGWDASGIVKSVGSAVKNFKVGDEVWYAGDITRSGSNATEQLIDSRIVSLKPKNLDWAQS